MPDIQRLSRDDSALSGTPDYAVAGYKVYDEVGVYFGVERMTVSRAVKKHEISRNKPDV